MELIIKSKSRLDSALNCYFAIMRSPLSVLQIPVYRAAIEHVILSERSESKDPFFLLSEEIRILRFRFAPLRMTHLVSLCQVKQLDKLEFKPLFGGFSYVFPDF